MLTSIKKNVVLMVLFAVGLVFSTQLLAHCQIPCGIYNDYARVQSMLEDVKTIQKSMSLIAELSGKTDAQSNNQLIRWVNNKEHHAQNIIETIADYFLTQRIKANQKDYHERLVKHHSVIVAAMKAKQNANITFADDLQKTIEDLAPYYPKTEHKH